MVMWTLWNKNSHFGKRLFHALKCLLITYVTYLKIFTSYYHYNIMYVIISHTPTLRKTWRLLLILRSSSWRKKKVTLKFQKINYIITQITVSCIHTMSKSKRSWNRNEDKIYNLRKNIYVGSLLVIKKFLFFENHILKT